MPKPKPKRKGRADLELINRIIAELKAAQVHTVCGDVLLYDECVRIICREWRAEKARKVR